MSFFHQSNKKMNFTLTVDDEKSSSMNLDVGKRRVVINPLMWSNGPNENNDFITSLQWLSRDRVFKQVDMSVLLVVLMDYYYFPT